MRNLLIFIALFFSNFAFAETAQDQTLATLFNLITKFISVLLGAFLVFNGINKMYEAAKDTRNPKSSTSVIISSLVAGAMLLNISAVGNLASNTFLGSGYCFMADNSKNTDRYKSCFSSNKSTTEKYLGELTGKTTEADSLKYTEKVMLLFTLFQVIAMVYMIKGVYSLYSIAQQKSNATYGGTLIQIIASSIMLNIPVFIDLAFNTLKSFR